VSALLQRGLLCAVCCGVMVTWFSDGDALRFIKKMQLRGDAGGVQ
jgi:hypothetical protein